MRKEWGGGSASVHVTSNETRATLSFAIANWLFSIRQLQETSGENVCTLDPHLSHSSNASARYPGGIYEVTNRPAVPLLRSGAVHGLFPVLF